MLRRMVVSQRQFEFVSSAFLGYKGIVSSVRDLERVEPVFLPATETDKYEVAKKLCP